MALEFKVYEGSETTLETLGTVATNIGKKGSLRFVPNTFTSGKRIAVILTNDKGKSTVLACSTRVSSTIREAKKNGSEDKELLSAIASLEISEDEEGRNFIIAPAGLGSTETFTMASLAVEAFSYEELIGY
jgi:hypothetical protein